MKREKFFLLVFIINYYGWYSIHRSTKVGNTSLFVTVFRQRMAKVVENTNVADNTKEVDNKKVGDIKCIVHNAGFPE